MYRIRSKTKIILLPEMWLTKKIFMQQIYFFVSFINFLTTLIALFFVKNKEFPPLLFKERKNLHSSE